MGRIETQILTLGGQFEIGVPGASSGLSVLSRSKNDKMLSSPQDPGRQDPFFWLFRIVGQRPALGGDRLGARIGNLNPIHTLPVFVDQTSSIGCQEFIDDQLAL